MAGSSPPPQKMNEALEAELETYRRENRSLAEQVKRLVRTESRLYAFQEELDLQRATYRYLADVGRKLAATTDLRDIFALTLDFVLYGLRLERVVVLVSAPERGVLEVRVLDGYYDEPERKSLESLTIPLAHALIDMFEKGKDSVCFPLEESDPILDEFRNLLRMDEFVVLPLGRSLRAEANALLFAGNRRHTARLHTRVRRDNELMATIESFANLVVTTIHNVRQYEELKARSNEIERASRMKSAFLATMSHELRTPLNAIIGFTRIVLRKADQSLPPKQLDNLRKVERSALDLLTIINDVLDISKVEAGRMEIMIETVDACAVANDVLERLTPLASARGLTLRRSLPTTPVTLETDGQRLRQVITNLVSNAIKFTKDGSVTLTLSPDEDGVRTWFSVEDTGIGIPAEQLDQIFEPFHQVDDGMNREVGGTGLGLAIVRQMLALLGGEIGVRSEVGKGSIFTFFLPAHAPTGRNVGLSGVGRGTTPSI